MEEIIISKKSLVNLKPMESEILQNSLNLGHSKLAFDFHNMACLWNIEYYYDVI